MYKWDFLMKCWILFGFFLSLFTVFPDGSFVRILVSAQSLLSHFVLVKIEFLQVTQFLHTVLIFLNPVFQQQQQKRPLYFCSCKLDEAYAALFHMFTLNAQYSQAPTVVL